MNRRFVVLGAFLAFAFAGPVEAPAQDDAKLREWLARFPEADADRDGTLTREEVLAFRGRKAEGEARGVPRSKAARAVSPPTHADVRYGDHERQSFDLWIPEGAAGPVPVHVFFHGGGFVAGDKSGFDPAPYLQAGFAAASGNYRFVDGSTTFAPTPMLDAARVIQTLRHRSGEWGLDPERVSVGGGSAGAVIALWIGFHDDLADPAHADAVARQSTRVGAVIPVNGPTNLDPLWIRENLGGPPQVHGALPKLFGPSETWREPEFRARLQATNPWNFVSAGDPPVLLLYDGAPEPVPLPETVSTGHLIHHPAFGEALVPRLREFGIPHEFRPGTDPRRGTVVTDWLKARFR
jgi:acetyl esterase/lipase